MPIIQALRLHISTLVELICVPTVLNAFLNTVIKGQTMIYESWHRKNKDWAPQAPLKTGSEKNKVLVDEKFILGVYEGEITEDLLFECANLYITMGNFENNKFYQI